ncbi:hypothetical protein BD324DRAFT_649461 [Kockovaella imperatae]|uniref:Uncharacterized protein n=1 Tax=Kockovaella imperatae TaxID=4999 RepID=A0A1Y1UPJ3_9TREE|nr:hypothetical protein BD324DRAFT_649461 [Kockovaella imperatae]ORX39386.1 hypothetical protein BD324DRAFT_649461 [Kockovaella imperatae]
MPITNPWNSSGPEIPPPPSSRPTAYGSSANRGPPPIPPSRPTQYSSLSDLTRGTAQAHTEYQYSPQPESMGYRPRPEQQSSYGASGRQMPPLPSNYGREIPPVPPRHAPVGETRPAAAPVQSGWRGAAATAGSYVPPSVSATASSVADRARDGFDSVFTNERKGQVMSGVGKAAAGAAKLTGKAAWSIGKFAAK